MVKCPHFLVIGAQKSGTTSLYNYLKQHPDIYMPRQKEVAFFYDDAKFDEGLDWYREEYFSSIKGDAVTGEASTYYMANTEVAQRIYDAAPWCRLIVILRNPIDRAYSQYNMARRRLKETRHFREAFFSAGNPEFALNYKGVSQYGRLLESYYKLFPSEQICVVWMDDLERTPRTVIKKLFEHVGVGSEYIPENLQKQYHKGGVVRWKWLDRLKKEPVVKEVGRRLFPAKMRSAISFRMELFNITPVNFPPIDMQIRKEMADIFKNDVALLEQITGLKVPWPEFDHGDEQSAVGRRRS